MNACGQVIVSLGKKPERVLLLAALLQACLQTVSAWTGCCAAVLLFDVTTIVVHDTAQCVVTSDWGLGSASCIGREPTCLQPCLLAVAVEFTIIERLQFNAAQHLQVIRVSICASFFFLAM